MSKRLLSLRHVPDDEADEMRALLETERIAFFETHPDRWGISAGALWIVDDAAMPAAGRSIAAYQARRRERARAEVALAQRNGTAASLWSVVRDEPLRVLLVVLSAAAVLAVMALPVILLGLRHS